MKAWSRGVAIALLLLTLVVAVLIGDGLVRRCRSTASRSPSTARPSRSPTCAGPRAAVGSASPSRRSSSPSSLRWSMVVVGIGFGALGLAFGLLTAAASLALVLSPFALIGWLLWRLFRERPAPIAASGP